MRFENSVLPLIKAMRNFPHFPKKRFRVYTALSCNFQLGTSVAKRVSGDDINMKSENSAVLIKKILCPTDFSRESQEAVEYAARLAVACDAALNVYHCVVKPDVLPPEKIENFDKSIAALIGKAAANQKNLQWKSFIPEGINNPAGNITAFARENSVDLIVMKSHYHPVSAHLFGSTIQRTVQTAPCPVLLLPFDWENAELNFRRILINYDFSTESRRLLDYAKTFADIFNAEIHLLHILLPSDATGVELSQTPAGEKIVRRSMQEQLKKMILAGTDNSYQITAAMFYGKSPQAMLEYAEEKKIDLICATAPVQKFYFETLFPTWLERVLSGAQCPVVVGGLSAIGAALNSAGITEKNAVEYKTQYQGV